MLFTVMAEYSERAKVRGTGLSVCFLSGKMANPTFAGEVTDGARLDKPLGESLAAC